MGAGTYTEGVVIKPTQKADLTIAGEGRDTTNWICPDGGICLEGRMQGYTGSTIYEISGFTFNVRSNPTATWGAGILINHADSGPLYYPFTTINLSKIAPRGTVATGLLPCCYATIGLPVATFQATLQ